MKAKLLREAGIDEALSGEYQLDHIIPLSVGGHPRKLSNLMLQPLYGPDGAYRKDGLELRLHNLVCSGAMTLLAAQTCIAEDWQACAGGRAPRKSSQPSVVLPAPTAAEHAERGACLIKGNINRRGERIYHVPGDPNYDATIHRRVSGREDVLLGGGGGCGGMAGATALTGWPSLKTSDGGGKRSGAPSPVVATACAPLNPHRSPPALGQSV